MDVTDIYEVAAAESSAPSLFPFPFPFHAIFVALALIFFVFSFIKYRKPYQLLFAVGIPASLLIWLADSSKALYYGVGAFELVIILGALVTSIIFKPKKTEETKQNTAEESTETDSQNTEE